MIAPADHLATRERHPILDDPTKWVTPGIWVPPSFDVAGFQKRIDAICGTSNGKPIIRLKWAWDKECRSFAFTQWDASGRGTDGEWSYKYRAARIPVNQFDTVDICPPRWILEERFETGQYAASWEQTRWASKCVGKDEKGFDLYERVELRPPPPSEWYGFASVIAEHDPGGKCCERRWRDYRAQCWGYYRPPSEKDLNGLRRAVWERDADPYKYSPHEPLPPHAIDELQRAALSDEAAEAEEKDRVLTDMWRDFVDAHGWRVFEDRLAHKKLKHGRFHFVENNPYKTTEAGLLVPASLN